MKNFTVFFFFCTFASLGAMAHSGGFLSSLRGFPGRRPIGSPTSGFYGGRTFISKPTLGSSGGRPIIRPARPTKSHCECINTWVNCCSSGGWQECFFYTFNMYDNIPTEIIHPNVKNLPSLLLRGVYLLRKPNFQLSHILAWLIFSCPPIGQESEFSVVGIKVDLFSYKHCVFG